MSADPLHDTLSALLAAEADRLAKDTDTGCDCSLKLSALCTAYRDLCEGARAKAEAARAASWTYVGPPSLIPSAAGTVREPARAFERED